MKLMGTTKETWYTAELEKLRSKGDAAAGSLVDEFAGRIGTKDARDILRELMKDTARSRHVALGEAIPDFLAGTEQDQTSVAELIDPEQVRHAQAFFSTFGLPICAALLHHSLPDAFAARRGAQALALTGELLSDPGRRVRETAQFLFDVMTGDPDIPHTRRARLTTLHLPDGRGARSARALRLFHAVARRAIKESGQWPVIGAFILEQDPHGPALGDPINQEDLLGTLLTFTEGVFEALDRLGIPYTADDRTAWFHAWNVVGLHMGIGVRSAFTGADTDTEWHPSVRRFLPLSPDRASELLGEIRRRHHGPSEEGKLLTNALLQELQAPLPRFAKPFPSSFVRYLTGDETADILGIRPGGWVHFAGRELAHVRPFSWALGRNMASRPRRLAAGELAAFMSQSLLQHYTADQTDRATFRVNDELCRAWALTSTTTRVASF